MKIVASGLLIVILLTTVGCTTRTAYGSCIGLNGHEDPTLEYRYSTRNIVLALIFWELVVPPVVVAFTALKCPEAKKPS